MDDHTDSRFKLSKKVANRTTSVLLAGLMSLSPFSTAIADDDLEFSGYFRTGANWLDSGGTVNGGSCYALSHPTNDGFYYRLGNECRDYAEFQFAKTLKRDGIEFKVVWMMDIAGDSRSATSVEPWSRRSRQLYIETDDILPNGATLWMGRRYYRGIAMGDIHIVDMFHVQSSGNGAGISDIKLSNRSKAHVAILAYEGDNYDEITDTDIPNTNNVMLDARFDTDLGDGGAFKVALQYLQPRPAHDEESDESGSTITLQWEKKVMGSVDQKTVFQYGTGSMAENPGCAGTDGGCMDLAEGGSGFRIFNNGHIFVNDRFSMNYLLFFEDTEDNDTTDEMRELFSVGVRPHYQLNQRWSFVSELATVRIDKEGADETEELHKMTLALQATSDASQFWDRPSLRFYLSQFNWNEQAATASNLAVPGKPGDRNALLLGVQGEVWF